MYRPTKTRLSFLVLTLLLAGTVVSTGGAGCGVSVLPFGQITAVQLFDEPDFTVALSVESAVVNPGALTKVNWVFGDGGGFVEGPAARATMSHRYAAPGDYEVTAFLFDATGFVDQITTIITVEPDSSSPPGTTPTPTDLPGQISGPLPLDEAVDVSVDTLLEWISGLDAVSHDVYLGTVEADVEAADTTDAVNFQGNQTENTFDPGGLDPETTYFWRIDEVNAAGTTKGVVMRFTTAAGTGKAESPSPAVGSTSARVDQVLQWVAGEGAASHDVYFGKDMAAVDAATDEDTEVFQGNQTGTSFDPEDEDAELSGQLLADTTYFWRIDELGPGGTTKGDIWSFKTSAAPPKITTPTPTDGAADEDVTLTLNWEAAPSVESFDVYFGMDAVDVGEATQASLEFRGNRTEKTFDPSPLSGSTTYFWRIDTLGAGGTTKGDVLSFTTIAPPGQVVGPFLPPDAPAPGSTEVDVNALLSWAVGGGGPTTAFNIYLSSNNQAVVDGQASALVATQDAPLTTFQFDEDAALPADTTQYWRIDAIGPGGITTGTVQTFTTGSVPEEATDPIPANGQNGVQLDAMLMWTAAPGANSYGVYFGTSSADVSGADDDDAEFQGVVVTTDFTPPGPLDGNTNYFWRIDSNGPGGTTAGTTWSFRTAPDKATEPSPADEDTTVALDVMLSWTAGSGAVSHDVYFGDDETAVTDATTLDPEFQGNQGGTDFTPDPLDGNKTYYWRIDEVGNDGTTKGDVWSFTTGAGQAEIQLPADGATGVELMPTLQWITGDGAQEHDIYLGTEMREVMEATRSSATFQGTQNAGDTTFTTPTLLDGFTFYFWRIDSVTDDGTTIGEVWQFRTRPGKATDPMPEHFAVDVPVDSFLQWTAPTGAITFEVYFGEVEADVIAATDSSQPVGVTLTTTAGTIVDPGALTEDTTYFWRVDSVAGDGTTRTTGDIWRFTTVEADPVPDPPAQAGSPNPFSGAIDVDVATTLQWGSVADADSYDVYLGTDMTAVTNATTGDAEFQGNQNGVSYNPGGLANSTTYYWRIDTVNDGGTTTGIVWSFTTAAP